MSIPRTPLHDEFDALWIADKNPDSDGDVMDMSRADGWFYFHRSDVYFALRDWERKQAIRAEVATAAKTALTTIQSALDTFTGERIFK